MTIFKLSADSIFNKFIKHLLCFYNVIPGVMLLFTVECAYILFRSILYISTGVIYSPMKLKLCTPMKFDLHAIQMHS